MESLSVNADEAFEYKLEEHVTRWYATVYILISCMSLTEI